MGESSGGMALLDLLLRAGHVVDGTGRDGYVADVGIRDGRIVSVGTVTESADRVVDADGLVVAPGVIDIHTHYDAQLMWDPAATPSPFHGVTTVIGGNCGYSIAPLAPNDDYVVEMMAAVEGIPLEALRAGAPWDWEGFGDWLGRFDGRLAVNAAFLVGHSTLRRAVMGPAAVEREATGPELEQMIALLHRSIEDGALGWSSSRDDASRDGAGEHVPARSASIEELLAMAAALGEHEGSVLEFIPAVGPISDDLMRLMADLSVAANRPLNWNLLGGMSKTDIYEDQLRASDVAAELGGRVIACAVPDLLRMRATRLVSMQPEFEAVLALGKTERAAVLDDPAARAELRDALGAIADRGIELRQWDLIEVAEATSPETERYVGKSIAEVARESGADPADVLLDFALKDELPLTMVLPSLVPSLGRSDESWQRRAEVWSDDRVILGGCDAGAHLDLMCHANYPSVVLGEMVRDRGLFRLEDAVRMLTQAPAALYGLRDRGVVAEGAHADLMVFDPASVGSGPVVTRADLPSGAERLYVEATGFDRVIVAGTEVVERGALTDARAGRILRPGLDTESVTVR